MGKRKPMSIKEFRELGYLQEVNRRFFHPLGLALEVKISADGDERLGGVWDVRDDPEGMIFDIENGTDEEKSQFFKNHDFIEGELIKRVKVRQEKLGFGFEPKGLKILNNK